MEPREPSTASERRQATVMFADISGFTAMSERLDPEDVTLVINRCWTILERIIIDHGGSVDKYIGDCIMALFGVPHAIENAPKQTVNAAIDIRKRLYQFDKDEHLPVPLDVHIGINSGLVIAGNIGGDVKREFTVMGDTVNLASRLMDAAPPGQIYVGAETYHATRGEFQYRPLKPLRVPGKEEPVVAYDLLSAKESIHRPRVGVSSHMISSEMIGRDREVAQLRNHIQQTLRGRGGIVDLVGEAGIGKSRLIAEVEKLDDLKDATVLQGRSLSIGQSLSFHPFTDLLKHWAGIQDDDDDPQSLRKLDAAITTLLPAEAGEVFPFIATLMGMRLTGTHAERIQGIEGEAMERLIRKSTRDLFQKLAAVKPLILIFEDLHWADRSSIKLLESLLRLVEDTRVLFIHVLRPDYPDTGQHILQVAREKFPRQHLEIHLDPLDDQESDRLIRNLLSIEDLPYQTRALISQKAEGNPFYIEEVVRSLIDEGAVEFKDGSLRITDKIHSVVIPGTIQEVVMARIDRLDEPPRTLLQVAAVIGRSFFYRIIADILGRRPDAELAYLQERQLISKHTTRRTATLQRRLFEEELEYVFKHALVQETIYESILQKRRKQLHLTVAQSIESIFATRLADFYGMLAYHYSRADSLEKAEEYLFKAGDEAARSAASAEALTYFREASRVYFLIHGEGGDAGKKAILEKNIGLALLRTGNLIECVTHFDRALEYLGERVPMGRIEETLWFAVNLLAVLLHLYAPRRRRGRPADEATARDVLEVMYDKARAQTTTDPQRFFFDSIAAIRRLDRLDPTTVAGAAGKYAGGAALFSFSGFSFAISRRFLQVARDLITAENVSDVFLYRLFWFVHNYFSGNWREPSEIDDALIDEMLRRGQLWDVDTYLGLDGEKQLDLGNFAAAQQRLAQICDITDTYGYEFARSNEYALSAFILLARRHLPAALRAAQRYHRERSEELFHLIALGTTAKIQTLMGHYIDAEDTLRKAHGIIARLGSVPPFHAGAYRASRFLLDVCELEQALAHGDRSTWRAARTRARQSGKQAVNTAAKMARLRTETYRIVGRFHWLLAKQRKAVEWWQRSIAEGERLGARPELARTYMEVGRRMLEGNRGLRQLNGMDAKAHLARARTMFVDMGLEWDLAQLAKIERETEKQHATAAA
jgi:class 3 adenylate cyclase/tetratricopeptide (TPR) repeat protein